MTLYSIAQAHAAGEAHPLSGELEKALHVTEEEMEAMRKWWQNYSSTENAKGMGGALWRTSLFKSYAEGNETELLEKLQHLPGERDPDSSMIPPPKPVLSEPRP